MSSPFSSLPVRLNGPTIFASWWNDIRTVLINFFGPGVVSETQFTIADNQSSYQNVTGLLFAHATTRSSKVEYTIYRTNGSSIERRETGFLTAHYKAVAGTWSYEREGSGDDALNVADGLIVNSSGQVQYKSDSIGATYVGKMRYKVLTSFATET